MSRAPMSGMGSGAGSAPSPRVSEDARMELAGAAVANEASNRPRGLVVLAGVLLVMSLAYLGWQWRGLSGVRAEAADREVQQAQLDELVRTLRDRQAADRALIHPADTGVASRIEGLLQKANIRTEAKVAQNTGATPGPGIRRVTYSITLSGQTTAALMEWLGDVMDGATPGLRVTRLNLTPSRSTDDQPGWDLDVTFSRLERTQ